MLGVFDSGLGGLTILQGLIKKLPQYSYLYYADSAHAPYGQRPAQEIFEFTRQGVEYLFAQGCPLVIIACNTASANALRQIQQEVLPAHYPDKRVLGIIVPTVEQISATVGQLTVGIMATEQTVLSGAYEREIHRRNPAVQVVQQACPELVPLIEQGAAQLDLTRVTKHYVDALLAKLQAASAGSPQAVLLGCTHYELVAKTIAHLLPPQISLYEQPAIVAKSLAEYLKRHPEIAQQLAHDGTRQFVTTGNPETVTTLSSRFFPDIVRFTASVPRPG